MSASEPRLVLTDLEPDDLLALILLAVCPKYTLYVCPTIPDILPQLLTALTLDGRPSHCYTISPADLPEILTITNNILCLMPPLPILSGLNLTDKHVWYYGGFNFRAVGNNSTVLDLFGKSGSWTHVYESFAATGPNNTLNPVLTPELYELLQKKLPATYAFLCSRISAWNTKILDESRAKVAALATRVANGETLTAADTAKYGRSQKIVASVEPFVDTQMLLADSGLAATFICGGGGHTVTIGAGFSAEGYLTDVGATWGAPEISILKDIGRDTVIGWINNILHTL